MHEGFRNYVLEIIDQMAKDYKFFLRNVALNPENFRTRYLAMSLPDWSYMALNERLDGFIGIQEGEIDDVSRELLQIIYERFRQEFILIKRILEYPENYPVINAGDKKWLIAQFDALYSGDANFLRVLKFNPEKILRVLEDNIIAFTVFAPVTDDIFGLFIESPELASREFLKALQEHFAEHLQTIS